ncbi:ornithine cyclodeaminase family protein [Tropicibacter naphthalenivorans]|uniref:Ornithine cyclodeaminase n=1 Tax=Tropicibacter naphthalenivorans TaxID=441103 RepID=A0A0P1GWZ3_9RHOB|nr:ornithine cyclodeaminase family protein [Tropicibacter naphthalenivorans]CUH79915.1 ornithine cyclodeaminase [Tropicibacter naphthalenivorans]SMC76115.1 ornithine cyclodeaminase [Tropicibacter naphthalenivorans]
MPFAPQILSDDALKSLGVGPRDVVRAIEKAVMDKAEGRLITTPKSVIQPGDGRYMMTTLATGQGPDLTVVKAVTVCPENPARGLPSITGAIMVLDGQTGECLALMDAEWITGVRTAGLSAVAALRLADPQASQISFVGTGVQARSHLALFAGLFPLRKIRVHGRGQSNIDLLCAMAEDMGLEATVCDSPQEALDADIVVSSITITYCGAPFLDARRMRPGALAIITDVAKPWMPEGLSAFDTVVVDDRAQEEAMPTPVVPLTQITGDLTDLVARGVPVSAGPRAFMFRGIAAGDYALAARLWTACMDRPS